MDISGMAHTHGVKVGLIAAAGMLCASCASTTHRQAANLPLFDQAVPFCEMMNNRQSYLGREILVRAFWVSNNHGSQIFDDDGNCPRQAIWLRGSADRPDDQRAARIVSRQLRREHYPEVVLSGSLRKKSRCSQDGVDGCFEYFFGDVRIIAARGGRAFHIL